MKQRILFLFRTYGLIVCMFLVAKVMFMLVNRSAHPFLPNDLGDVLRHGLTLDLSTGLYFLIPPFLLTIVSIWWVGRGLNIVLRIWSGIAATAFGLAFAADTALYPHWGYKLDATCLQYLSTPEAAAASVKTGWLILGFLGLLLLIVLLYWALVLQIPKFKPLEKKWPYGLVCLIAAPLMFVGIRGGVDKSTTNIGQVYYSQTPYFNHAAVNPVFSFLSSFGSSMSTDVHYDFFTPEERDCLMADLYNTESLDSDTLLRTQRPNIILVMLEGTGGQFMKIGGRDDIMPHFNRMTEQGVYFSQCYANSFRTDRATVCIWSGHQSFPTLSLQKIPQKNCNLPGLAHSLREAGYDTHYYYGGDINFTKMRSYLINIGFERFTYKSDFSREEQRTAQWGVCDSIVFQRIVEEVKGWGRDTKNPHLIGYNTLSSHEPWDVPTHRLSDPVENSFDYLDQCMNQFVTALRRLPQWDNLLLIFIPDHGVGLDEKQALKMHIPVLWMGGAVREPREVDAVCNQSDQAATLLGQLGLTHTDYRFSRDVLSKTYNKPFAFHSFNNGFSVIDSTNFVVYDLTGNCTLVGQDEALIRRGKAILQVASEDLKQR